jgi:hypothetical protein
MNRFTTMALVGALALAGTTGTALADRKPTQEELTAIEARLKSLGYTEWEDIELDDGKWEIDDAVHNDGKRYDLELAEKSLEVVKKEIDD